MFPSRLCCAIWAKYAITILVHTYRFEAKREKERFTVNVVCPPCRQNLKIGHFTNVALTST